MMSCVYCFHLNPEPSSKDSNQEQHSKNHREQQRIWCMFIQPLTDLTKLTKIKHIYIYIALTGFNTALIELVFGLHSLHSVNVKGLY